MNLLSSEPCVCFQCGAPYQAKDRVGRNAVCLRCGADLHCCLNCRHHNAHAHNECNETQAEWVRDKDRSNYCDYFDPKRGAGPANKDSSKDDARVRFDSLFKK
jgi:hypothetical protein